MLRAILCRCNRFASKLVADYISSMRAPEAETEHIKRQAMFEQVGKIIRDMLDSLASVYLRNEVDFAVAHYQPILMRILSPLEINNQAIARPYQFYFSRQHYSPVQASSLSNSSWQKKKSGTSTRVKKTKTALILGKQLKGAETGVDRYSLSNQLEKAGEYQQGSKKVLRNMNLGTSIEENLCSWIKHQMKAGKKISRKEVTRKACSYAHEHGRAFLGSQGWYNRFLGRHPDIKALLDLQKVDFGYQDHKEQSSSHWNSEGAQAGPQMAVLREFNQWKDRGNNFKQLASLFVDENESSDLGPAESKNGESPSRKMEELNFEYSGQSSNESYNSSLS